VGLGPSSRCFHIRLTSVCARVSVIEIDGGRRDSLL